MNMLQTNTIFVDVDGTIHNNGRIIVPVLNFCQRKKQDGFSLVLWSARGQEHAQKAVELFKIGGLFDYVISKPGGIVDDRGWSWIKYARAIKPEEIKLG
jgi:hydroxymethylpyrimidine pyrophosphatase-like HAD family hydrolase